MAVEFICNPQKSTQKNIILLQPGTIKTFANILAQNGSAAREPQFPKWSNYSVMEKICYTKIVRASTFF